MKDAGENIITRIFSKVIALGADNTPKTKNIPPRYAIIAFFCL